MLAHLKNWNISDFSPLGVLRLFVINYKVAALRMEIKVPVQMWKALFVQWKRGGGKIEMLIWYCYQQSWEMSNLLNEENTPIKSASFYPLWPFLMYLQNLWYFANLADMISSHLVHMSYRVRLEHHDAAYFKSCYYQSKGSIFSKYFLLLESPCSFVRPSVHASYIHIMILDKCIADTCIMDKCLMNTCIMDTCIMDTCIMDTYVMDTYIWIGASCIRAS